MKWWYNMRVKVPVNEPFEYDEITKNCFCLKIKTMANNIGDTNVRNDNCEPPQMLANKWYIKRPNNGEIIKLNKNESLETFELVWFSIRISYILTFLWHSLSFFAEFEYAIFVRHNAIMQLYNIVCTTLWQNEKREVIARLTRYTTLSNEN